jgi:hypothetical protein
LLPADFSDFSILVVSVIVCVSAGTGNTIFSNNVGRGIWEVDSVGLGKDTVVVFLGTIFISVDSKVDSLPVGRALGPYIVCVVLISSFKFSTLKVLLQVELKFTLYIETRC